MDMSELKETVEPDVLAEYLGLEYQEKGGRFLVLCPFHGDRKLGSAYINNGYFHCFSCGESMDIITLVMRVKNVGFFKAVKILSNITGIPIDYSDFSNNSDGYWKVRLNQEELDVLQFPSSSLSLRKIYLASPEIYKKIVVEKAKEKKMHYESILADYADRFSPEAYKIYELYNGEISPEVFRNIKNETHKRLRVVNMILERFE